jgi:hypothetical protein
LTGWLLSRTVKSLAWSPRTGCPCLSLTSTSIEMRLLAADSAGAGWAVKAVDDGDAAGAIAGDAAGAAAGGAVCAEASAGKTAGRAAEAASIAKGLKSRSLATRDPSVFLDVAHHVPVKQESGGFSLYTSNGKTAGRSKTGPKFA